ncbi:MAG TPA: hypothetical protein VJ998_12950 [Pseudomonadales bacterium]|nr:hypothetical protein [Pseudomonadales bacterium]
MRSDAKRVASAVLLVLLMGGCVRVDIGGTQQPTLGKQLIDLHTAKQAGAITAAEFDRLQSKVLTGS